MEGGSHDKLGSMMFERIVNRYRGSTVVVVGAGGIGTAIARLVGRSAARVVVADHSEAALERLRNELTDLPITTRVLDVRRAELVDQFVDWMVTQVGVPHFFFYTAGVLNVEPFLETSAEAWLRAIDINLNGAFHCTKAIAARMATQRQGSILLLGSIAGTRARSGTRVNPSYNASKAALSALVNGTAMQLRPYGVRINCISPGPTATAMMNEQPVAVHDAVRAITLDGRMNDPLEVAELALFVAGHGRFTGEDLGLGGGAGLGG